jgi:hypothetical protein
MALDVGVGGRSQGTGGQEWICFRLMCTSVSHVGIFDPAL